MLLKEICRAMRDARARTLAGEARRQASPPPKHGDAEYTAAIADMSEASRELRERLIDVDDATLEKIEALLGAREGAA